MRRALSSLSSFVIDSLRETTQLFWTLLKISLPLIVAIRFLDEQFNIVELASAQLADVMGVIGLPGATSLVVATAFLTNLYAAAVVYVNLGLELTIAQTTILLFVILIAHGLPVECRIAQKAGMNFSFALLLRLGCALLFGWILMLCYGDTYLQSPAVLPLGLDLPAEPEAWGAWWQQQFWNWLVIFLIILALVLFLNFLKAAHIERWITARLAPLFRRIGIGHNTLSMAMIGILLGLSYGGGLLIREFQKRKQSPRELLCVLATLSLCHSIIEDTLLMILLGAHWSGVLLARVVFTLIFMLVFAAIIYRLPAAMLKRLSPATS